MEWSKLEKINEAPEKGQILAYTREKVVFHSYENLKAVKEELSEKKLLELHLFDSQKEYRAVCTRSKRYENGVIETIVDFSKEKEENIYQEQILLEKEYGGGCIFVLNHIDYEKNGMAVVNNYCLLLVGGENE